jgi:hypothetical protein
MRSRALAGVDPQIEDAASIAANWESELAAELFDTKIVLKYSESLIFWESDVESKTQSRPR